MCIRDRSIYKRCCGKYAGYASYCVPPAARDAFCNYHAQPEQKNGGGKQHKFHNGKRENAAYFRKRKANRASDAYVECVGKSGAFIENDMTYARRGEKRKRYNGIQRHGAQLFHVSFPFLFIFYQKHGFSE